MQSIDFLNREIFLRFGNVSRARGPFLYTEKSVRLTDMFQENGRAILGWGGSSAFTFFKNVLSRGQTGSFKTVHRDRLKKAVNCLFNDSYEILILKDKSFAAEVSENIFSQRPFEYRPWLGDWGSGFSLGKDESEKEMRTGLESSAGLGNDFSLRKDVGEKEMRAGLECSFTPSSNKSEGGNISSVRDKRASFGSRASFDSRVSFDSSASSNKNATPDTAPFPSTIIFTPPLAWAGQTCILLVKESLFLEKEEALQNVSEEICPPCLLQAWTRSVYDLIKALQERQEKDWFIYDQILTKYFVRKGPYLKSKVGPEKYPAFVKHCLDCHIVINPDSEGLSIVPFSADKGVFGMLKKNPFTF